MKETDGIEMLYDLNFLTELESKKEDDGFYWLEIRKMLDIKEYPDLMGFLINSGLTDTSKFNSDQVRFAMNTLFNVVHQKGTINFYLEQSDKLDKVLQIFIRINSGGTKLSYPG